MVNEVVINVVTYYQCEKCRFHYSEREWAEKCQAWCEKNRSCNINITKNVVEPKR